MTDAPAFEGFSTAAIQFLADLAANNDRTWFQPRKAEYERLLKHPMEALCAALAIRFSELGIPLDADPARSPFRIYRDTRFAKDKSPYKTAASARFPWRGASTSGRSEPGDGEPPAHGEGPGGVAGYFHLQPGEIYVGGGMWHPSPARLAAWRASVAADARPIQAALEDTAFTGVFGSVNGERMTRVPAGFSADHPAADLLKLKSLTFGVRLSDAEVTSATLPDTLATTLTAAVPVLRLLAELPG